MKPTVALPLLNLFLVASLVSFGGAAPESGEVDARMTDQKQLGMLAKPLYEFGGKLLLELRRKDAKSNLVFSPISIHQALSMLLVGVSQGSETRRELLDAIGYSKLDDENVENRHLAYASLMSEFLRITAETTRRRQEAKLNQSDPAHRHRLHETETPSLDLFTVMVTKNKGRAKPAYSNKIKRYFNSTISSIDDNVPETKARLLAQMNEWGEKVGFESNLMTKESLDEHFEALLIAAISVEAFWFDRFHENSDHFNNLGLESMQVKTKFLRNADLEEASRYVEFTSINNAKYKLHNKAMSLHGAFVGLSELNFQAIEVYLRGDLSLTILEPLSNQKEPPGGAAAQLGANARLNRLTEDLFSNYTNTNQTNLEKALELLRHHGVGVDYLNMPKFKFESDINLKSALNSMGVKRAFDQSRAEISNVTENGLFISDVRHKAVIETTKKGIKAAGVTIMRAVPMMAVVKRERIAVVVKNPFIFLLKYKSVPLFLGQLTSLPETESG